MKIKEETQVPRLLNQAVHNFSSALSKRIFWAAMSQIRKGFSIQKDLFQNLWITVPTSVLNDQRYSHLVKASRTLQKARFEFNNEKEEEFLHIVPFPVVSYTKRSGEIRLKVDPDAYKILGELSSGYFWIRLKSIMILSSKYSQRWYELFSEKKNLGEWNAVEIDEIQRIMRVKEGGYSRPADFLKRVIYDPIKEINERTEMLVTYKPMYGQKRPILGFDFKIQGQKAKGEAEMYEKIEQYFDEFRSLNPIEKSQRIQELQREYSFPEKVFNELFENTSLLDAVLEADAAIKAGRIEIKTTKGQYMGGVIKKAKNTIG